MLGQWYHFFFPENVIFGNFKSTLNIHKIRKNGWYFSAEKFSRCTYSLRHNFFHERIKDTLASHLPGTPPSLPIWAPPLPPPPFQKGENQNAKTLILLVVLAINSLAWTWLPPPTHNQVQLGGGFLANSITCKVLVVHFFLNQGLLFHISDFDTPIFMIYQISD